MQQQREREKQSNKQYRVVGKTTILHMDTGGYSRFQVTGMFEWGQKSKPEKIPWASNKNPKKSLDPNLTPPPPKIPCQISEP